jgi:hypothetical protein
MLSLQSIRKLTVAASLAGALATHAQVVFTSFTTQTIDFDNTVSGVNNGAFTGTGFQSSPTAGQLDSDAWAVTGWSNGNLAFGGTQTTAATDYTRGTTAAVVTTGGIYGYDVDATAGVNRALGIQPGGSDWAPGTLTLRIQNSSGSPIASVSVDYTVYVRNDQGRANSFNFSYSTDNTTYTSVASADLTSTATLDALGLVSNSRSVSVTGLTVTDGSFFYLRWSGADVSGAGSRDEFALDDIDISVTGAPVPEPSTYAGFAGAMLLGFGVWRRSRQS